MAKHTKENFKKLKISVNTTVHCPTPNLASRVLAIAHELGFSWWTGGSYIEDIGWGEYKEDTCYDLVAGSYSCYEEYQAEGYSIITAEDFINRHKPPFKGVLTNGIDLNN